MALPDHFVCERRRMESEHFSQRFPSRIDNVRAYTPRTGKEQS
jgi:hypothetical protein